MITAAAVPTIAKTDKVENSLSNFHDCLKQCERNRFQKLGIERTIGPVIKNENEVIWVGRISDNSALIVFTATAVHA